MPLTDPAIRNAKPKAKPYRLHDEKGLYLEVAPSGGKWWRFKYRIGGKEKRLSLGVYPDTPLADKTKRETDAGGKEVVRVVAVGARTKRDEARALVAEGIDPGVNRKAIKTARADRAANSFEVVAREWFDKQSATWVESHGGRILKRLERDIFPWLGARPISEITPPELLATLRRIEARGAIETAHRARANCGQVFCYAIATGRATSDPSRDLRGALTPMKGEHFAAITDPKRVPDLLRSLDAYEGTLTVKCALRLAPLVFVRPGELRNAQWADIDLEAAEWRFTVSKTKTEHIVPLSRQAVAILKEIQPLTGAGQYVFPGARSPKRPMSENAVLAALRGAGISREEMTGHGFRAMARTLLDEALHVPAHLIEHQLAHAVRDPLGRAYNRTAHLPERQAMMQQWADYLDKLKAGAEVIEFKRA